MRHVDALSPRSALTRASGALVCAALLAGCAERSGSAAPSRPSAPATKVATAETAQRVCAQLAVASVTSDTRADSGPADARRRAARLYGTPGLQQWWAGSGTDPQWSRLHQQRATITARAAAVHDDLPPSDGGSTAAAAVVSPSARSRTGVRSLPQQTFYCSLLATPAGWRVDRVQLDSGAR